MPIIHALYIDRATVRAHPLRYFIFGDNLQRQGLGGQAAQMRGEANALGLITKKAPRMDSRAFLHDEDLHRVRLANKTAVCIAERHLRQGGIIVWPEAGIGTGFADLAKNAPLILQYYHDLKLEWESIPCQ